MNSFLLKIDPHITQTDTVTNVYKLVSLGFISDQLMITEQHVIASMKFRLKGISVQVHTLKRTNLRRASYVFSAFSQRCAL